MTLSKKCKIYDNTPTLGNIQFFCQLEEGHVGGHLVGRRYILSNFGGKM